MQNADDVVGGAAPQRHARMRALQDLAHHRLGRIVGIDRTHLGAMDHDVGDFQLVQVQQRAHAVAVLLDHAALAVKHRHRAAQFLMRSLVTLANSSWLASIVLPHQPHFIGQPKDVDVFWGYGLFVDKPGDFVKKPMHACTGREIMMEIMGHLRIETEASHVLATATCIPCMMPFFTSQFLRRQKGDRPHVIPKGWTNLAFTGQFCELPDDVVFTIEYSIRSAMAAVYGLLDLKLKPPPVYQGQYDPHVLIPGIRGVTQYRSLTASD